MNRQRVTGLALVTLALIAVVSTSALRSRTVAGRAVVLPPPQVGDCWTGQITAQLNDGGEVLPLASQPCDGSRLGEVAFLDNERSDTPQDCGSPARQYLGLATSVTQLAGSQDRKDTTWSTLASVFVFRFGPDPLQVAAGQVWSACVVLGAEPDGRGGLRPDPFSESVRSLAASGGAAFNRFASCTDLPTAEPAVACGLHHRYEIFLQTVDPGTSEAISMEFCTTQIRGFTGMADPSAGGQLRVVLLPVRYDPDTGTLQEAHYQQARSSPGSVSCALTPTDTDRVLTETLYGISNKPLPIK